MPKELDAHRDHPNMIGLTVHATDYPGPGGAHHRYVIGGFDLMSNPASLPDVNQHTCTLVFQQGAVKQVGVNGVTHEALLAVVIDRLEAFQAGPYACSENALALDGLRIALKSLKSRTARRTGQGIEGTMAKDPVDEPFTEQEKAAGAVDPSTEKNSGTDVQDPKTNTDVI